MWENAARSNVAAGAARQDKDDKIGCGSTGAETSSTALPDPEKHDKITPHISAPDHGEIERRCGAGLRVSPLSARQLAQLADIGLSIEDYEFFLDTFVGHRFDFAIKPVEKEGWFLVRNAPLTHRLLLGHLSGSPIVATGCRWDSSTKTFRTNYFAVDLDMGEDPAGLLLRYDRVVGALGAPTLLLQSSNSRGLHLYYLLDTSAPLHALRAPDGSGGTIVSLLNAAGLHEEPGSVEIYPRGHYAIRGVQNRLRLPFGSDSYLLDPDSLLPLHGTSGAASLRTARQLFENGKLDLLPCEFVVRQNTHSVRPRKRKGKGGKKSRSTFTRPPDAYVAALWDEGLSGPRQLNSALFALGNDLFNNGVALADAQDRLVAWLRRRHNGQSRTFNKKPGRAIAEARAVCDRVYGYRASKPMRTAPGLSMFEAESLLHAFGTDAVDPRTGEVLSRYKADHFAFELLRCAKQWLLAEANRDSIALVESGASLTRDYEAFARRLRRLWPDRNRPVFIVPCPYQLRVSLRGISEEAQWPLWRAVQEVGLYRLHRKANPFTGRAAMYRVSLDFGSMSPSPKLTYTSLAAAAGVLLSASELRERYSRHYVRRILKATGDDAPGGLSAEAGLSPFEALVQRELGESAGEHDGPIIGIIGPFSDGDTRGAWRVSA